MKKIIAAALSIIVGAFGYTIVDKAVEDRVTSLESEVIELREEVSKYHPKYSEKGTFADPILTTIKRVTTTRKKVTTTYNPTTGDFVDPSQPLVIGSYLIEKDSSVRKFLIRENLYGGFEYVSSNNYEPVSLVSRPSETTEAFTRAPSMYGEGPYVAEYFVYINDCSAQITDITEEVSYRYSYDEDYSSVSEPISKTTTFVTVLCKGYTDPALSGKKIILNTTIDSYYYNTSIPKEIISNTINSDGSFEYKAVHSTTASVRRTDEYSFTSIKIA